MKSKVVAEYNLVTEIKKVQEEQRRQIETVARSRANNGKYNKTLLL